MVYSLIVGPHGARGWLPRQREEVIQGRIVVDQMVRILREFESEDSRLKKMQAECDLESDVMKDIAKKGSKRRGQETGRCACCLENLVATRARSGSR